MDQQTKPKGKQPFPYTDGSKRYHTYDYWLKSTFGGKCAKIPLDAGFTCPNMDGTCGTGGCIYCSGRGSGDFAESPALPLREQYDRQREFLSKKWPVERCIPYFQARTNTYGPAERLRSVFEEVLTYPGAVGLNIATRADCLPADVVSLLGELSEKTVLTVELGLQTTHDETAARINRGHTYADFLDGYTRLRAGAPKALICVHLIFGLPGEGEAEMLETVRRVAELRPDQVKIHLLHVLRGTALGETYQAGEYLPLEKEDYISIVVRALELLPPETVVARLTGDGAAEDLLAPLWSRRKREVLNGIDKRMVELQTWQGAEYKRYVYNKTIY
ncbi:MAG: TIGR01212 family radical SAM protein [Ruminococcaceae bacterium]|nr:TIGR01212 family radical SAM protein [Oscillospiraceae bacterium]